MCSTERGKLVVGVLSERARDSILLTGYPGCGKSTVSVGVTALSKENDTVGSMLHAVKAATFQAQRLGKNAVAVL